MLNRALNVVDRHVAIVINSHSLYTFLPLPSRLLSPYVSNGPERSIERGVEIETNRYSNFFTEESFGSSARKGKKRGGEGVSQHSTRMEVRSGRENAPPLPVDVEELYRALGTVCLDALSTD